MDLTFKINLKLDKNTIPDIGWLIYFTGMFCFYQHTYFQLAIQLAIIAYSVVYKAISDGYKIRIKHSTIKNLIIFTLWIGLLFLTLYISKKTYAVFIFSDSKTLITIFRIFVIGFAMFYYADTRERALAILKSFVLAVFLMGVLILLVTPTSAYFVSSNEFGFGSKIGHNRNNIGAIAATAFIASYYLRKFSNFKLGYTISIFLIVLTFLTGSRSSILQIAIEVFFIMLFNANLISIFFFVLGGGLLLLAVRFIPILYDNIWLRFMNAADTVSTGSEADTSALGRQYYKEIAWKMFLQRPYLGWGVDGFKGYLTRHPIYKGRFLNAVYSHCNFTELMSSLGIVGLLIWYVPTFYAFIKSVINIRKNKFLEMSAISLFSMIIMDYARIPWSSHIGTYTYIICFIVILIFTSNQPNKETASK